MRLSLRARLFVLVLAINVGVFAVGGAFLLQRIDERTRESTDRFADGVVFTVSSMIRPGEELNAARILSWPSWNAIDDALLVSNQLELLPSGRVLPRGVALNPVGTSRREPSFDGTTVLGAIAAAIKSGAPVEGVADGRAVPIRVAGVPGAPEAWGGCWYRLRRESALGTLARDLLPWFMVSTLLLVGATFLMLRGLVLEPVEALVEAARRVRAGDLSARVGATRAGPELAELSRSFDAMVARVEGQQRELDAEVARQTAQARTAEAAALLQRRLASMGELAAGIAHEINNPLGGLINATEALRRADLPPAKRAQYLDLVQDGLERIRLTVRQLLRFTPREATPSSLLVSDVARDALALVRHRAERAGVELELVVAPHEPAIEGLRNELGQALLNLLANALDALESAPRTGDPRVGVRIEARGGELVVAVQDNGPGMSEELLPKAADLFFTTKEVGKGTGLGLGIVHAIARKHRGRLSLSSTPGTGFRAELALPLATPPSAGSAAP
jgi:signal transduction histidine kinase